MKASKFAAMIKTAIATYGDLPIVGGSILDDASPSKITALDEDDVATQDPFEAVGFYLE